MGMISIDDGGRYHLYDTDKGFESLLIRDRKCQTTYEIPLCGLVQTEAEEANEAINFMVWVARGQNQVLDLFEDALQPFKLTP